MSRFAAICIGVICTLLCVGTSARASIVFDDFNTNEGHFALQPSFSGQSNVSTASTADRITSDTFEGAGSESINAILSTTNPARIRFLSGGGTPSSNTPFTTTAGTDGFIGFYYKTSSAGIKLALNLDGDTVGDTGSSGATSELDMSSLTTVNADGNWHLMEWDLDGGGYGAVSSIGGGHAGGLLLPGTHWIDSIYIQNMTANSSIQFDFVAKSDSGSISALLPEPGSMTLLALTLVSTLKRRRRPPPA